MIDLKQQRIVITGGDGFLGRHVQAALREAGVAPGNVQVPLHRDFDLTRAVDVERMYAEMRPTVVIHLAAEVGGIGANRQNPGRFFYANMAMGLHVIEVARSAGLEKFVQVGTVCAYPKHTAVPFKEDDLWNGYPEETNAPYGLAKKMLLVQSQAYRRQYDFNSIFLLPVNLYGPRDNFDPESSHVIPALIRKCIEARESEADEITCWGTGSPTREFLFVEDAARAILLAAERYDASDPVNVGSGQEISIRALTEEVARACGFTGRITWDAARPDGQPRRRLDTELARRRFEFEASTPLAMGLSRTIEWYESERKHLST